MSASWPGALVPVTEMATSASVPQQLDVGAASSLYQTVPQYYVSYPQASVGRMAFTVCHVSRTVLFTVICNNFLTRGDVTSIVWTADAWLQGYQHAPSYPYSSWPTQQSAYDATYPAQPAEPPTPGTELQPGVADTSTAQQVLHVIVPAAAAAFAPPDFLLTH